MPAYKAAVERTGTPTVILAKTVKGYGLGSAGEGMNVAHQQKKLVVEQLKAFRDRFAIPISDKEIEDVPFIRPDEDSARDEVPARAQAALGGSVPARRRNVEKPLPVPALETFKSLLDDTGEREISTTMAFVRGLQARHARQGRRATRRPDRRRRVAHLRDGRDVPPGRDLLAAGPALPAARRRPADVVPRGPRRANPPRGNQRSGCGVVAGSLPPPPYSTHGVQTIPFFIFYSMFGFQRIGDFIWAAGDMRSRGFLVGGTAGPDDSQRRGLAARGRTEPRARIGRAQLRGLRPDLLVRGRGDRAGRLAAHDRRTRRRLLLPHGDERELPSPGDAGRRRKRHRPRSLPVAGRRRQENAAASAAAWLGDDLARGASPPPSCCATSASRPKSGVRHELQRAAPRRLGLRPLEHAAPDRKRRAFPGSPSSSPGTADRSSRRRTT